MSLSKELTEQFKNKLEKDKADIETELRRIDADKVPDFGSDNDHYEEEADEAEEFTTNAGIANELKNRLRNIEAALEKIKNEKYGQCEKCDEQIALEVLNAAPESQFCKQHKQLQ